jgi:hypothetical protein
MKTIFYSLFLLTLLSCAQFIPPTGGPKDKDAPILVSNYPEHETLSFKGQTIKLEFNELIDATTLRQELIITPQPEGSYNLKAKPFGVELKFDTAFKDSTTYTLNFRNGIKDLNEKNPAVNLKLVFSTGTTIDSLKISGKVHDLFTGLPSEKTLVGLYDLNTSDTLPLLNRKPNYFIKTDTSGIYSFENIKSSNYRIIAFQDLNLNLFFDPAKENFGYIRDTIDLKSNINQIDFNIYPNNNRVPKIQKSLSRQSNYSLTFDKGIKDVKVEYFNENDSLTYQIRGNELLFFNHPFTSDTILTKIIVLDSSDNKLEKEQKIYFNTNLKNSEKPEFLTIVSKNIKPGSAIKKIQYYEFQFQYPINNIDTNRIYLLADTIKILPYKLNWIDNSQTQLRVEFNNTAEVELKLSIVTGAVTNYKSDSNNTYTLINKLYQQNEYAGIEGSYDKFVGQKIIQILDYKTYEIIDSQIFTSIYSIQTMLPGTYKIRIIEDLNNNGRWDTSDFENNTMPEKVIVSSGILKLKANFQLNNLTIE